jgi:coproporphyrinogen III oxidase
MPGINMNKIDLDEKQIICSKWFEKLRDQICEEFELIELEYAREKSLDPGQFNKKAWDRDGGGGGVMSVMHGNVFEKVGVNISTVHGEFSEQFRSQIPGAEIDPQFFATGISLVAHMRSPIVPAVHFNTRYIRTSKEWFGGGGDLTPIYPDNAETSMFHEAFEKACNEHNPEYYPKFKQWCDEYFYLKHRNEPRGVGGIFYDYVNSGSFENDFAFTQSVGKAFLEIYPEIVRKKIYMSWTESQREYQLQKRGRYVEFNLLYDRGTTFGLMTGGNVEAILMSMPPLVTWK